MPIHVVCPSCQAKINAPDKAAGKRLKCPKCGCRRRPATARRCRPIAGPADRRTLRRRTGCALLLPVMQGSVPRVGGTGRQEDQVPKVRGVVHCLAVRARRLLHNSRERPPRTAPLRVQAAQASLAHSDTQPTEEEQPGANPNLQACPDCGKTVSKRASQCPACGCPLSAELDHKPHRSTQSPSSASASEHVFLDARGNGFQCSLRRTKADLRDVRHHLRKVLQRASKLCDNSIQLYFRFHAILLWSCKPYLLQRLFRRERACRFTCCSGSHGHCWFFN